MAAIKAGLGFGGTTPAPTVNPKCAALTSHMNGAMYGATSNSNAVLQGYLLGEGASIPALKAGAAFGFYGAQTANAVNWYKMANNCQ